VLPKLYGDFYVVFDPEVKFSGKGNAWMKLRGKASDRTLDDDGNWQDTAKLFIDIVIIGKQAEHVFDSVAKGDIITVAGKLEQSEWTDKDGNQKTDIRVVAEHVGVSVQRKALGGPKPQPKGNTPRLEENPSQAVPQATEPPF